MLSTGDYRGIYLMFLLLLINNISINAVQIRVENRGGYVARVLIHYHNSKNEEQSQNSGSFTTFRSALISVEDGAKSMEIEVQMYAFINTLRTIFKTSNSCAHTRCFVIWGTVFKAEWNELCCQ